jgi:hypothetical protein
VSSAVISGGTPAYSYMIELIIWKDHGTLDGTARMIQAREKDAIFRFINKFPRHLDIIGKLCRYLGVRIGFLDVDIFFVLETLLLSL